MWILLGLVALGAGLFGMWMRRRQPERRTRFGAVIDWVNVAVGVAALVIGGLEF